MLTVLVVILAVLFGVALLALAVGVLVGTPWILYSLLWAGFRARLYPIAARNLWQHRRRTLLLGGAIGAVTALLVVLLGLTAGVRATILESATTLMAGHVNVGGFFKVTAGSGAPLVTDHPKVAEVVRRAAPEVDYIAARGRGWAKLVSETGAVQAGLAGIDVRTEPGFRKVVQVVSGDLDGLAEKNTLLLFESHAKRLDVKVGDTLTVVAMTLRGTSNTVDARVVAIAKNLGLMSQFSVFMDAESLREIYKLNEDTTGALYVYLRDLSRLDAVAARLRTALAEAGYTVMDPDPNPYFMKFEKVNRQTWTGQRLDVTTWEDEISFIRWVIRALDVVVFGVILVLVAIIGVGVMNTLWIAIRERTREIGTLRAIGMQRRYVLATFVIEAFVLSLASTIAGALIGLAFCVALDAADLGVPLVVQLFLMSDTWTFTLEWADTLRAIGLISFCMTFVALVPSYLAARMKPISAMHHIG